MNGKDAFVGLGALALGGGAVMMKPEIATTVGSVAGSVAGSVDKLVSNTGILPHIGPYAPFAFAGAGADIGYQTANYLGVESKMVKVLSSVAGGLVGVGIEGVLTATASSYGALAIGGYYGWKMAKGVKDKWKNRKTKS